MKIVFFVIILLLSGCKNSKKLVQLAPLSKKLNEVSGIEKMNDSDLLWMHNDSGNKSIVYGVTITGNIQRKVAVKATNNDWEDITSDEEGNLYIGDFGNNNNKRKNLKILKILKKDLFKEDKVPVEKIKFKYPDQYKFPPEKDQMFFDAESLLYLNGFLYVFTKSDVKHEYGKTKLYKIPAKKGSYEAEFISEFNLGITMDCRITSASISPDKKKVALLTSNKILIFTNFIGDNFFKGDVIKIDLMHTSQKEAITFKDNNTVYITDERNKITGGNLYEYTFSVKQH